MDVTGRVIVVTGGAKGIGRALAKRLATAGAKKVVVADIDLEGASAVAREIDGTAVRCDVSREGDVKELVDQVETEAGRIDIFCSNAGIAVGGGPEASDDQWQRIWDVNLMSHVFVARHVLPGMLKRGEGYLLGTVSAAGLLNHVFAAPYGVTKAAALSLFGWLSIALGERGFEVSFRCPQGVNTDMLAVRGRQPLEKRKGRCLRDAVWGCENVVEQTGGGNRAEEIALASLQHAWQHVTRNEDMAHKVDVPAP